MVGEEIAQLVRRVKEVHAAEFSRIDKAQQRSVVKLNFQMRVYLGWRIMRSQEQIATHLAMDH